MPRSWDNPNFFERFIESRRERAEERRLRQEHEEAVVEAERRHRARQQRNQQEALSRYLLDRVYQDAYPPLQTRGNDTPRRVVSPERMSWDAEVASSWFYTYLENPPVIENDTKSKMKALFEQEPFKSLRDAYEAERAAGRHL